MSVDFSGFQSYYPDPFKSGYVVDQSQLIQLPNQGSNSASTPSQPSGVTSRPSRDIYEPSGSFTLPDSFTFTVPGRIGYIDFSQDDLVWKDVTEHVGESFTVPFNPPEKPKFDPYDYYTDDVNSIRITERNPDELNMRKPLHAFLQQTGDTLANAAQHLLAKGAITSDRCECDLEKFATDTLDFFTGGKYTNADVNTLKDQLHQVVQALAEQLKAGGEMDIGKVNTKLTIGGVETSATELFQFQKVGRILEESLRTHGGNLMTVEYGKTGVTVAAAKKFAASHGELGKMFSQNVDRFYEQHRRELYEEEQEFIASGGYKNKNSALYQDSLRSGLEILDVYAKVDFGDPSSIAQAHRTAANMVKQHCDRFGLSFENYPIEHHQEDIEKYAAWINTQIFE